MIRQAQPGDAASVIPLIYSAIGDIAFTLTGTTDPEQAQHILREFYERKGNRLSYENTLVAERDGLPVGFILFYHGSRTAELDRPLAERLAGIGQPDVKITKEARDDEFYLDSLAVDPAYQGQGIAKALMEAFEAEAARRGYDKVSLIVEESNGKARRLYEAKGYEADGRLEVSGHLYDHMVKRVVPAE
ncbi:acetyltransferase [Paenibacillus sp. A3]|uniref:GNAT family N-acetyltransferase n=1 Tax=Paenibacillus sp. A3 TaxID=1337054 RepID=UPI0006D5B10F|nr:N-acetyltransferase [Paenibacillus sp. A3]KPV60848.1 acetyltransferase [Paenibacillus sp. A3]